MTDPYRMVVISLVSSIIASIILLTYFRYKGKRKINYLFLVLLVSIPPILSIFRPGSYESGDLSLHAMRTMSFYNILFNEHILPRWTPEFNAGYGDPHFLFAYFFPYFLSSIFHFIGFSFLMSIKLLLALSFILSGISMYLWAKDELGKKAGFVSAIFYLFAPYHLVDLNFRVTIAENLSFVFLPLLLLLAKKIINKPSLMLIVAGALCYGLLILTHQITSLTFTPVLIAYAIFVWFFKKRKTYKDLFIYFSSIILGLLLSAFYWIPIVFEAQYTQASLAKNISSFTPFIELLYSPWRFGFLFQGHKGELSFLIGYTQIFIVVAAVYLLFKKSFNDKNKKLLLFFLIIFCLLVFMITPHSKKIWETIPLFKYSQYSYRLLEFVALCTSIIAGIVVTKWNKKIFIICLCIITIFYTLLNWGNRKTLPNVQDAYLIEEFKRKPDIPIYLEPSSPIWANLEKSKVRIKPKDYIEVLSGNAEIKNSYRSSIHHEYIVDANSIINVKENTLYFPGWKLFIDRNEKRINYENPNYPGVITFTIPKGLHKIELSFKNTSIRNISINISVIAASIVLLSILLLGNNANISRFKRKRKIK